jgi:hypothetical protein
LKFSLTNISSENLSREPRHVETKLLNFELKNFQIKIKILFRNEIFGLVFEKPTLLDTFLKKPTLEISEFGSIQSIDQFTLNYDFIEDLNLIFNFNHPFDTLKMNFQLIYSPFAVE